MRALASTCLWPFALSACLGTGRAYPLYESNAPLPREQLALVSGYVRSIDGKNVSSLGGSFELLPGCHVIETPGRWTRGSAQGAVVVSTGHMTFALPMRAGHAYHVDVQVDSLTGPTGTARVVAQETNAAGDRVAEFGPAGSQRDVEACELCARDFDRCKLGRD